MEMVMRKMPRMNKWYSKW